MKKIYIAIAVLVAAALTSCQQEQSFEDSNLGENGVAFVLQGGDTRAIETSSLETPGVSIDIAQVGNQALYMEETITDLNGFLPETKGTPVYTENVGKLDAYKEMIVNIPGKGDASYESIDAKLTYVHDKDNPDPDNDGVDNLGWRYQHRYPASIWPASASEEVQFYFRMPASMKADANGYGATFADGAHANGKTTFTYTSPTTAAAQQDILFSYVSVNKENYKKALPNGYPVTMYHALSGIKFAISNAVKNGALEMGIQITGISFIGVKNTGTCTINAGATAIADKVKWGTDVKASPADNVMSQTFAAADNMVTYTDGMFPSSFATTGTINGNNEAVQGKEINHAGDAAYTFWIIPQDFANSSASIRIDYKINGNTEYMEIPLKSIAKKAWGAGQLRTFTFKLNDVNVKIDDTVTIGGSAADAYSGSVKNGVTITNTGNTDAFIRAALVGQWWSKKANTDPTKPEIVFGFTDAVGRLDVVESWYEDQFVSTATPAKHGTFVGLPGYKGAATFKKDTDSDYGWVLCDDNYYYYTKPVAPNGGTTSSLFTSYTLGEPPTPTYGGQVWSYTDIYFTLEVATQAISANNLDGSHKAWDTAWEEATTIKPVQKQQQ